MTHPRLQPGFPGSPPEVIAPNDQTYTPLTDIFPETEPRVTGFSEIDVPSSFTAGTEHAWYGLMNLRVGDGGLGQECALFGLTHDVASCDYNPQVPLSNAAWGSKQGLKAAIVVGDNLPIEKGKWTKSAAYIPGFSAKTIHGHGRYWWIGGFPTGNFSADNPVRVRDNKAWAPYVFRVPRGTRIQVALVIDGAQAEAAAGSGKTFIGYSFLQLNLGLTRNTRLYDSPR